MEVKKIYKKNIKNNNFFDLFYIYKNDVSSN